MKRFTDNVLVQWPRESNPQEYQILAMLPFDSTRKMMSVLVRYPKAGFRDDNELGDTLIKFEIRSLSSKYDD